MSFSIVRSHASGLSRYCSFWLLSAFLVLLGGYLSLYADSSLPPHLAMADVFRSQLLYQFALVLVLAFLYRARGEVEHTIALLAILGVFMTDGLLVQHRFGWAAGDGRSAALLGIATALAYASVAAVAVELNVLSRLFGTVLMTVVFVRVGPTLLIAAPATEELCLRFVALGWWLAALALPTFILTPTAQGRSRLPLQLLERWGVVGCFGMALLHFVPAGESFDLRFSVAYLAPLCVVLAPLLVRLLPDGERTGPWRRLIGGLPYLGLALASTEFPAGLGSSDFARTWPLTPFYLVLLLAIVVQGWRWWHEKDLRLAYATALLGCLACLGGDLPEMLMRARFPSGWQVLVVSVIAWGTIVCLRSATLAKMMQALPAFMLASWLAEIDYSWSVAWLSLLCLSALAIEHLTPWFIAPLSRLAIVSTATLLPVVTLLYHHDSRVHQVYAITVCVVVFVGGVVTHDRLLRQMAPIAAAIGVVGLPFAVQRYGEVSAGRLITQLGFVVLLVGVLNTLFGDRLRARWAEWWEQEVRPLLYGGSPPPRGDEDGDQRP